MPQELTQELSTEQIEDETKAEGEVTEAVEAATIPDQDEPEVSTEG
jgi:hypothetical protein